MYSTTLLLPQHKKLIEESGISEDAAGKRGYFSALKKAELKRLGFGEAQLNTPALVSPVYGVTGAIVNYQSRPDTPRVVNGKAVKYETPRGSKMALDVNPLVHSWLGDPSRPLFVTEGIRKADSAVSRGLCCIGLLGVWNWRGRNDADGVTALPDWDSVALKGRRIYVCFDSDVMVKKPVRMALKRLKGFLELRGADVRLIYLPVGDGGAKQGLDDFFASGKTVDDLLILATADLRGEADYDDEADYEATDTGLIWRKATKDGSAHIQLANFNAFIMADIVEDDGVESMRKFELEVNLAGSDSTTCHVHVAAARFSQLYWVTEALGAKAVIYPGMGERAACAIRLLSQDVETRRVYAHTGWRCFSGEWLYLHGGGAIGAGDPQPVEVNLPEGLKSFILPTPPEGEASAEASRAILRFLNVAPFSITSALLGAAFAAVLGAVDFSLLCVGPTGVGKTELSSLIQQLFGKEFDSPSTGIALEALAYALMNSVLVVDDFAPAGSSYDVSRLHRDADRLLRAQGNMSGRARMRSDTTLRPQKYPRGLIISTGEDIPKGHSLRARNFILEIGEGEVNWELLTECQRDARAGAYALGMAAFLNWLAPAYGQIREQACEELEELRHEAAHVVAGHKRVPGIVAHLYRGWCYFLAAAVAAGSLSCAEAENYKGRIWSALADVASRQAEHHVTQEPAARFLELIIAAVASGRAHIAGAKGVEPTVERDESTVCADAFGWRKNAFGWEPKGELIGWVDEEDLYLQPDAAFSIAQRVATSLNDSLPVSIQTLWKRLHEGGHLASTEVGRETLKVRRTLGGSPRSVIHLRTSVLVPEEHHSCATPDIPDNGADTFGGRGEDIPPPMPTLSGRLGLSSGSGSLAPRYPRAPNFSTVCFVGLDRRAANSSEGSLSGQAYLSGLAGEAGSMRVEQDITASPDSEEFAERAAIFEYEHGLPRRNAEEAARRYLDAEPE
jgi:hypothetical protein